MSKLEQQCKEAVQRVADAIDRDTAKNMREMLMGRRNTAWGIDHEMCGCDDILSFKVDRNNELGRKLLTAAMTGNYSVTLYEMGYAGNWLLRSIRSHSEIWLAKDVLAITLLRLDVKGF